MSPEQPIPINDLLALQLALSRYESVADALLGLQGGTKATLEKVFSQHGKYSHMKNLSAAIDGKITAARRTSGDLK